MSNDPFDALYVPTIAVRPRPAFMEDLRRRMQGILGTAAAGREHDMTEQTTATPTSSPIHFALHYRDTTVAVRWLTDVLGLATEWVHPPDGPVQHASLRWGSGTISINYKRGIYDHLGPSGALLDVDSDEELDVHYRRISVTGADIARPLGPNWDGRSRNFVVRDPEGNLWELAGPSQGETTG